jgi:hypothetical protein
MSPVSPLGSTRLRVCVGAVPVIVAAAVTPVLTVPTESVLAGPVGPVSPGVPCGPWSFDRTRVVSGVVACSTITLIASVSGLMLTDMLLVSIDSKITTVSLIESPKE